MNTLIEVLRVAPAVLVALAVLVIALRGFRRLEARMGSLHVDVEQVSHTADAVNRAVNCVGDDQPTLRNMVVMVRDQLADHISSTDDRLSRIEEHLTHPPHRKTRA
jgi:hypothetical protein